MYNKKMCELGNCRSAIRELFEYGKVRAKEMGADKVYDFSLGNPSVPSPNEIKETLIQLLTENTSNSLHGYTSAQGALETRVAIACSLNKKYGAKLCPENIYITVGAAAGLCIVLKALNSGNDEFIVLAPFFPEYKVFIESQGGVFKEVPFNESDFSVNLSVLENSITNKTKGVIVNSPNNPSGVVYSEETVKAIAEILKKKSQEYKKPIYIISDEPYRELVYDGKRVPFLMNYYDNTIICYSFSKSLSLPGERIGYIAVSEKTEDHKNVYASICGAGRGLGYVCAPSLFQKVIEKCIDAKTDIAEYDRNRKLIYGELVKMGYECIKPDGAFYLFIKSPEKDANVFCDKAKQKGLLIVPGDSFGAPGYARIAYCVDYEMIKRSLPAFKELISEYSL
jgi:aspartate aminotransferase